MAISDTKLRNLYGKPYSGPAELTDVDGLSVRVTPKGVVNFQYRYRWQGKQYRLGLGKYPALSLRDARNAVADLKELLDKGIDPRNAKQHQRTQERPTIADCLHYWMKHYVKPNLRPATIQLYQVTVMKHMILAFPNVPAQDIPVNSWVQFFSDQEKINPIRARQLLSQARSAINWCIRRQFLPSCEMMKIYPRDFGVKAAVGEVTLSYNQLAKIWLAIERSRGSTANKMLHQMLMLYGARNSELRDCLYPEFDREEMIWTLPASRSKTKKIVRRPIFKHVEPMIEKLQMAYGNILFPGPDLKNPMTISGANRFLGRIQRDLGIGDFTAHDFRRTLATRLSEDGVAPHVIEKMLGHELGGVLEVYNKHDWLPEQKEAYELFAEKILSHVRKLSG